MKYPKSKYLRPPKSPFNKFRTVKNVGLWLKYLAKEGSKLKGGVEEGPQKIRLRVEPGLTEAKRDPEKINKLVSYIAKRRRKAGTNVFRNFIPGMNQKDYPTNGEKPYKFGAPTLMQVPIRAVRSPQKTIGFDTLRMKVAGNWKNHSSRHPLFYHNVETGDFYVRDGNHRVAAARLKGDEFILGHVIPVQPKKPGLLSRIGRTLGLTENWKRGAYFTQDYHNSTALGGNEIAVIFTHHHHSNDHFNVDFTVNDAFQKHGDIHNPSEILQHVGQKVHQFIRARRPKKLTFTSHNATKFALYTQFAHKVVKKYGGTVEAKPELGLVSVHLKEDLSEAKRTPTRAAKLWQYIMKRRGDQEETKNIVPKLEPLPLRDWAQHEWKGHWKGDKATEQDVPIEKLRTRQDTLLNKHMNRKLLGTPGKDSPGHAFYLANHDTYFVIDGNHRVAAAKLRGDKTVRLPVQQPKGKLTEVARNPERATKLWQYILKKRGHQDFDHTDNILKYGSLPTKLKREYFKMSDQERSNFPQEDIPLHKIVSRQTDLVSDSMPGKIHKKPQYPDDPPVARFIYNHEKDIYHLMDGNHRVAAAKLRGDKTIRGGVFRKPGLDLNEQAKRTPERATKLWLHILKKRGLQKDDFGTTGNILPQSNPPAGLYRAGRSYKLSMEHVPVHKIVTDQTDVTIKSMPGKIAKKPIHPERPPHPIFVYNSDTDKYHLMDGNHRVAAARLRGETHIHGEVKRFDESVNEAFRGPVRAQRLFDYIMDNGNHRTAAARLRGDSHIWGDVYRKVGAK